MLVKACTRLVVERKDDADDVQAFTRLVVEGKDDADDVNQLGWWWRGRTMPMM